MSIWSSFKKWWTEDRLWEKFDLHCGPHKCEVWIGPDNLVAAKARELSDYVDDHGSYRTKADFKPAGITVTRDMDTTIYTPWESRMLFHELQHFLDKVEGKGI